MTETNNKTPVTHLRAADIRGFTQLTVQAVTGVTRVVEGVHESVLQTVGVSSRKASGATGGLTGLIYRIIYATTRLTGKALDKGLEKLLPKSDPTTQQQANSSQREILLSVLNGVIGDRLAHENSSFAMAMELRYQGKPINLQSEQQPSAQALSGETGKLLIMVHGLCLSDRQWQLPQQDQGVKQGVAHGEVLASKFGYSPIYLRYNSGLHISQNGRELSQALEALIKRWPVPVSELSILGHSMGGLVARSAAYYAQNDGLEWQGKLKNLIFLGTPHHGAPLERAGHWIDTVLGKTRYSAPFARLGKLRSSGIKNLRHGYICDQDWRAIQSEGNQATTHKVIPLPDNVNCYAIAASNTSQPQVSPEVSPEVSSLAPAQHLIGDGLVPIDSALGVDQLPERCLAFQADNQWIAYETSHMALLSSSKVNNQLQHWLKAC